MIRNFEPQDQVAVQRLILSGLRERWGDTFDESYNGDVADIAGNYQDQGADVVVVDVDGSIIATGSLIPEGNRRGRIVRMSVAASSRRQGFGRMVVKELIARAQQKGLTEVSVLTDTPWTSAVALYLACGFEEIGRDETDTHFAMFLNLRNADREHPSAVGPGAVRNPEWKRPSGRNISGTTGTK